MNKIRQLIVNISINSKGMIRREVVETIKLGLMDHSTDLLSRILPRVLIVSRRTLRKNKFVDFVGMLKKIKKKKNSIFFFF